MDTLDTKKYELCFWLKDDGTGVAPIVFFDSVKGVVQKAGGFIISERQPEKRNLAYAIQKQRAGYWCEIMFSGAPEILFQIKTDLKYETAILRKIIVVVPDVKEKKVRSTRAVRKPESSEGEPERATGFPQEMQEQLDSKLKEILES